MYCDGGTPKRLIADMCRERRNGSVTPSHGVQDEDAAGARDSRFDEKLAADHRPGNDKRALLPRRQEFARINPLEPIAQRLFGQLDVGIAQHDPTYHRGTQ